MADGWGLVCECVEPQTAEALQRAGGAAGIVDNRRAFVGIDRVINMRQPFYRVQLREGRGHYCAQELLESVPLAESFRIPIRGTSFFFREAHAPSGCLLPRRELAQHYPEDVEIIMRAGGPTAI